MKKFIKIGITAGDPAGIGPEVILKAINELQGCCLPIVIARYEVLKKYYPELIRNYKIIHQEKACLQETTAKAYILDMPLNYPISLPGRGNADTGKESCIYIEKAVELWKLGIIDAIVTGPVSKAYIEKSGLRFTGHTEYIAKLINEENPFMLMYSDDYRVLLVTTHIPVADIPRKIDADKIYNTIAAGYKTIKSIDQDNIRIAIAGLDPHCGDEGAIGTFDMQVTRKAVERAINDGIKIEGPFSADALFTPHKWKSYNLAIAHYHDQGLIPFKALAFDAGVNVTIGLSIIRTSPDHGTAFDIAGKNLASHKSMLEAIKLANKLAGGNRT